MQPPRPYFSAQSKEAAHCGRFGALGTKLDFKMAPGGNESMVDFLPFFIYFARLVAIKDGSNRKNWFF